MSNRDFYDGRWHYPLEICDENRNLAGLDHSKIKFIKDGNRVYPAYMVELRDEEEYRNLISIKWAEDQKERRMSKCLVFNEHGTLVRCKKDCSTCPRHRTGTSISLEYAKEEEIIGHNVPDDDFSKLEDRLYLESLITWVSQFDSIAADILRLLLDETTEREIAKELGIPKSTIHDYISDIKAKIRKHEKD